MNKKINNSNFPYELRIQSCIFRFQNRNILQLTNFWTYCLLAFCLEYWMDCMSVCGHAATHIRMCGWVANRSAVQLWMRFGGLSEQANIGLMLIPCMFSKSLSLSTNYTQLMCVCLMFINNYVCAIGPWHLLFSISQNQSNCIIFHSFWTWSISGSWSWFRYRSKEMKCGTFEENVLHFVLSSEFQYENIREWEQSRTSTWRICAQPPDSRIPFLHVYRDLSRKSIDDRLYNENYVAQGLWRISPHMVFHTIDIIICGSDLFHNDNIRTQMQYPQQKERTSYSNAASDAGWVAEILIAA